MWSPPRARSTLMMRVFAALGCSVLDEPFYAYWLKALDKRDDPGFAETLAAHESEPQKIIEQLLATPNNSGDWIYQKHMAIHMLPEVDLSWMSDSSFVHCFLIRDPREVIASMTEFRDLQAICTIQGPEAAAQLVGIPQLNRIYKTVVDLGQQPVVLDANSVLADPSLVLKAFCDRVGLPFDPQAEISWAPGQHATDGAWAPFWYQKIFHTSTLKPRNSQIPSVPATLQAVVDVCMPTYELLYRQRVAGEV